MALSKDLFLSRRSSWLSMSEDALGELNSSSNGEGDLTVISGMEVVGSLMGDEDSKLSEAVETRETLDPFLRKLGSLL